MANIIIFALLIIAAVEGYVISRMSQQLDDLSDKYLDAMQEIDPINLRTKELIVPAWWEYEHDADK